MYNGRCGVSTDDNGLYYMRQRYYNPEIKRFVNQDILTGSIGNSQSLNRYSYVQGNPVSYTDPFGLSPLNGMFSGTMFIHTVLGLIGWIPGPVGAVANLIDGIVYAVVDKDYKNAFFSFGSAVTFGTGKIVAAVGKGSKTALRVQRVCDFAGSAVNFLQSADGTYQTASMMAEKYIVQDQPFSGSTVLEVGLLAANIFGAYKSGTYALNDVADFGNFAKQSWTSWRGTKGGSVDVLNGEEPFLKLDLQYFASDDVSDTTRVGRWMSQEEYHKMVDTGYVQKPYNADQSYVANPADYNAFYKQAKQGTVYVEFDVPTSSLKQTKDVWATIPGPNSMYSKLNKQKGLPPYEFPKVSNILLVGKK